MRSIWLRTFFMAIVAVAMLVNSGSSVLAVSCSLCGSFNYHCRKNCASKYPNPPASWRCMATCSEQFHAHGAMENALGPRSQDWLKATLPRSPGSGLGGAADMARPASRCNSRRYGG
jgi:hypothetical protein